jgi:hypothetical protein
VEPGEDEDSDEDVEPDEEGLKEDKDE